MDNGLVAGLILAVLGSLAPLYWKIGKLGERIARLEQKLDDLLKWVVKNGKNNK